MRLVARWRAVTRAQRWTATLAVLPVVLPVALPPVAVPGTAAPTSCAALAGDRIHQRTFADVTRWLAWLSRNHARGIVTEIGWPNQRRSDAAQWDCLARGYLHRLATAGVPAVLWDATERPFPTDTFTAYQGVVYGATLSQVNSPGQLMEQVLPPRAVRAVSVSGAEQGYGNNGTTELTNAMPASLQDVFGYPTATSFRFLAAQGIGLVRLPFRWERIQPRLGAPLATGEVTQLVTAVHAAEQAGLRVILDLHNYAGYYVTDPSTGQPLRLTVGSRQLPATDLADVWRRLATVFRADPHVMYALMNEPTGVPTVGRLSPAQVWQHATQLAVTAIRSVGDRHPILVSGIGWDEMVSFPVAHPRAWVVDPVHAIVYEVHDYWDTDRTSRYQQHYDQENAALGG